MSRWRFPGRPFRFLSITFLLIAATVFAVYVGSVRVHRHAAPVGEPLSANSLKRSATKAETVRTEPVVTADKPAGAVGRRVSDAVRPQALHPAIAEKNSDHGDATLETRMPGSDSVEDGEGSGREDWFFEQRAYPAGVIPHNARLNAIEHVQREELRLRQLRAGRTGALTLNSVPRSGAAIARSETTTAALPQWQSLGPAPIAQGQTFDSVGGPVSGRVTAIALDPGYNGTSNQTVYVGGAQGGVWKSINNGANWTPITDDQPSLAIGAIAIDPTNGNTIYVGTGEGNFSGDSYYGAGLLKSTDGGKTWTQIKGPVSTLGSGPAATAFTSVVIPRIAIDPVNPSTIFVCTNANGHTGGASGGAGSPPVGQRGIWRSTDGGQTWTNVDVTNNGGQNSSTDILIDPLDHTHVFAAIQSQGIFSSTTGGAPGSFQALGGGVLPSSGFTRVILTAGPAFAPATNSTLYAAYANSTDSTLVGIFRSTDGGVTWTKMVNPQNQGQANYNLALAVDPVDPKIVYYGTQANSSNFGGTVWRSLDGGTTWNDISMGNGSVGLHADTHVLVTGPTGSNVLFTGNDGGIWRSDNASSSSISWTDLNLTLSITQFQSVALHPTDPNTILGGTQDNGTNLYSGSSAWTLSRGGDGGFALIDQSNPLVMYHTFFNQNNSGGSAQIGPQLSINGGVPGSWRNRGCFGCGSAVQGNFNPADRVGFYAPMALNTAITAPNGNVIYFGTNRLYRSPDQGTTWTGLGSSTDGFGADLTTGTGRLSAVVAHPTLSSGTPPGEVVWVGTSDGQVQVTTNAGATDASTVAFTNVTKSPLPNRFVTDIALDPANQQHTLVTFSGFNINTSATPGHVFQTTDQGSTWTDISGNLADVPVTSVVIDPVLANTYYIGTDIGVFQTTDGGQTWVALSNGMPKVAVFMLRYHAASRSLVAATHGRGMYRLPLSSAGGPVAPTITWNNPADIVFGTLLSATQLNPVATSSGVTVPGNFVFNPPAGTVLNAGSNQPLAAAFTPNDSSSFLTANATITINVSKAPQTINFPQITNKTFGDPSFQLVATATSNLPVSFSIQSGPATIAGTQLTINGAGTVVVLASRDGDSNHTPATSVMQTFTVAPKSVTLTIDPTSLAQTFNGSSHAVNVTTSVLGVSGVSVTYNGSTTLPVSAGSYTVVASLSNQNFQAQNAQATLVIAKAANAITSFGPISDHLLGDSPIIVNPGSTSGLAVSLALSANLSLSGTSVSFIGAGSASITASQAGDSNHVAATSITQNFTIRFPLATVSGLNPATIAASGNGATIQVMGSNFFPNASTVQLNGANRATTFVSSSQLNATLLPGDLATAGSAGVSVLNPTPGGGTSNVGTLKIIGVVATDTKMANAGGQITATALPTTAGRSGLSATLTNSGNSPASITVTDFSGNPTTALIFDAGSFVSIQVQGVAAGDIVNANFYYSNSITGGLEANLKLLYFNGTKWVPVVGSQGATPGKNTTDNLDGTVSGGRFQVTFDGTSSPSVSQLTGTMFAMSVNNYGDLNGDGVVDASDLVLLANILAGNVNLQPSTADMFLDGQINAADLVTLANFLAGNISVLPVAPNSP